MNVVMAWVLGGVALLTIAGLAFYAYRLWREVKRREAFKLDEVRRAHEQCLTSLEIIARAMLEGQMDLIEGALRCKVLLEIIDPALIQRRSFNVFYVVYSRTTHLHTHSARKDLTSEARRQEDRERQTVAEEFASPLASAAREILVFKQEWPASLH